MIYSILLINFLFSTNTIDELYPLHNSCTSRNAAFIILSHKSKILVCSSPELKGYFFSSFYIHILLQSSLSTHGGLILGSIWIPTSRDAQILSNHRYLKVDSIYCEGVRDLPFVLLSSWYSLKLQVVIFHFMKVLFVSYF